MENLSQVKVGFWVNTTHNKGRNNVCRLLLYVGTPRLEGKWFRICKAHNGKWNHSNKQSH